ncbi:MAG: hypothetical protein JST16_07980 [Bdellovibrionales bacterium]|nr:hypothetical protein [Bdellovibrionales bacterium]
MAGMTKALVPEGPLVKDLAGRKPPVKFITLNTGTEGSLENRAERLVTEVEKRLADDPNFKCHFVSHSLGGVVSRYAMAHLKIKHPLYGEVPFSQVAQSLTTIGTPHRGTPLGRFAKIFLPWNKGAGQMSKKGLQRFNDPAFPKTYSPRSKQIPLYSYRLTPNGQVKCGRFLERVALKFVRVLFPSEFAQGHSDSISSEESQSAGEAMGDLNLCHSYFSNEYRMHPSLADFYEMQAWRVQGKLDEYRAQPEHAELWEQFKRLGVYEDSFDVGDPALPVPPDSTPIPVPTH